MDQLKGDVKGEDDGNRRHARSPHYHVTNVIAHRLLKVSRKLDYSLAPPKESAIIVPPKPLNNNPPGGFTLYEQVFGKYTDGGRIFCNFDVLASRPLLAKTEKFYGVYLRYCLGSLPYLELFAEEKFLVISLCKKSTLMPTEFEATILHKLDSSFIGIFDNIDKNATSLRECHCIQLPSDANFEEESIQREDHVSPYGVLLEIVFKKKLTNAIHLLPKKPMWGFMTEGLPRDEFRIDKQVEQQKQKERIVTNTEK